MGSKGNIVPIDNLNPNAFRAQTNDQVKGANASYYVLSVVGPGINRMVTAGSDSSMAMETFNFVFPVSPQVVNLDEPPANDVTATQSGVYVEEQGQFIGNLTIEGTFGFRPSNVPLRDTGVAAQLQRAFGIDDNVNALKNSVDKLSQGLGGARVFGNDDPKTGIARGEITGLQWTRIFRNIFAAYHAAKNDSARASQTIMLFGDLKMADFWLIVPGPLRTYRDSRSSPMTYRYQFQCRTVARADDAFKTPAKEDFYVPAFTQDTLVKVLNTLRNLGDVVRNSVGLVGDTLEGTAQLGLRVTDAILEPLDAITEGIDRINTGAERFAKLPADIARRVARSALDFAQAIDRSASIGQQVFGGRAGDISHSYKDVVRQMGRVDDAFGKIGKGSINSKAKKRAEAYLARTATAAAPLGQTLGRKDAVNPVSQFDYGNLPLPESVAEDVVRSRESIKRLARRLLGDAARWKEIVLLNQLEAPYLSTAGNGKTILRPGDRVLYPVVNNLGGQISNVANRSAKRERKQKLSEDQLGTDVALTDDFDLVISPSGDLSYQTGRENLRQALRLAFATQQGELKLHPYYGVAFPIGTKALFGDLADFLFAARVTLAADPRIAGVARMNFELEGGDTVRLRAALEVVAADNTLWFDSQIGPSGRV